MNGERFKKQLESILQVAFRIERLTSEQWQARFGVREPARSIESDGMMYYPIEVDGSGLTTVLTTEAGLLTESERQLVELAIEASRDKNDKPADTRDEDDFVNAARQWIEERVSGEKVDDGEPPAALSGHALKLPFILYGEYTYSNKQDYADLKKLLESYFDSDILLIPLRDKEWLILGDESLLREWEDDPDASEGTEDQLASLCHGLHAVISAEGAGECHVSVHYPIVPAKSLPGVVGKLREAMSIGRQQRVGKFIHLPWELYLDQLLSPLPHSDRMKFIEQVFKRSDPQLDPETIQTLETFFELDCNVSETAKKLYVHRNTLLYRLDKFKQESGLDVRTFNQAVHVKIALQLYKVTKRH